MSIDLARTLHDTVDGAADAHADLPGDSFDVDALCARVRRRRTRRAVARGTVGAGAAGVLALAGAQVVGRRGPDGVLPAANPSAAPGTCGSDVDALASSTTSTVDLTIPSRQWSGFTVTDSGGTPPPVASTVVLAGRAVSAMFSASVTGAWSDPAPVDSPEAQAAQAAQDAVATAAITARIDSLRVVVADAAGTIVGTELASTPDDGTALILSTIDGSIQEAVVLDTLFDTCSDGTQQGGAPLPDGTYEVFALAPDSSEPTVAGGPWEITLEPELQVLSGLPEDYPAEEVPVVGESVITAVQERGSNPGWLVRTATDSVGALDSAVSAVTGAPVSATSSFEVSADQLSTLAIDWLSRIVATEHWEVTIREVTDEDGRSLLQYQLTPL